VRGRLGWMIGGASLAGAAVVGVVRKLRRAQLPSPPLGQEDPRALELRQKLDESKGLLEEREEFESAETPVDRAEPTGGDLAERRRQVHERGRGVAEEMRGGPAPD
jgi:hypothetical protein